MTAVVDYGMGNVASVLNMLRRIGTEATMSGDPDILARASRLILPGVGAFDAGMRNLRSRGLLGVLRQRVLMDGVPVLGICLGMQLLTEGSEEGGLDGLGWIPGRTVRFRFEDGHKLKVPHIGWNYVRSAGTNPLVNDADRARFYFVHGYHVVCRDEADVAATARYGFEFACAVQRENVFGVQFHPEKSHRFGMTLLDRFVHSQLSNT
jgi:imidazole glycerol-phosphate synthase subunit HisH